MADVTDLLRSARTGDAQASGRLFELVYADLKRLAHSRLYGSQGLGELDTTVAGARKLSAPDRIRPSAGD